MPLSSDATIGELQNLLASGEISSRELVLAYLQRIAKLDQSGPKINSILEVNPDALFIADAMDNERSAKSIRGLLHGIPILLKDNINTCDRLHTSAGSLALANHYATRDAFVVQRLREAGAIILGKSNMTEWANLMSSKMPAGYSSRGGQVLNPYGPGDFFVGGSSSGSAAAVASGFATVALGTETSGSILSPACHNSLVGIKPTVGLVSRSGVIPVSYTQDTVGVLARSVSDAAITLTSIIGHDEYDPATWSQRLSERPDFAGALRSNGLQNVRIGIPRKPYFEQLTPEETKVMDDALVALRKCGAELVDIEIPSSTDTWDYGVAWMELKSALNHYLGNSAVSNPVRSLRDIIEFNNENAETSLRYGQDVFESADQWTGSLRESEYLDSLTENLEKSRSKGIDYAIESFQLDALLYPHDKGFDMAARAGYPSITVPAGYTPEGRPIGVQFTGPAFSETALIGMGYAFEQETNFRAAPRLD